MLGNVFVSGLEDGSIVSNIDFVKQESSLFVEQEKNAQETNVPDWAKLYKYLVI